MKGQAPWRSRKAREDTIGSRIAVARIRKGLTQAALAKQIGRVRATVNMWEQNRLETPPRMIHRLAGLLDSSPAYLAFGVREPTVGERIADAREAMGMSRLELSRKLGKASNVVVYYESGKIDPPLRHVIKMAELLNVSPVYLAFGVVELPDKSEVVDRTEKIEAAFDQLTPAVVDAKGRISGPSVFIPLADNPPRLIRRATHRSGKAFLQRRTAVATDDPNVFVDGVRVWLAPGR